MSLYTPDRWLLIKQTTSDKKEFFRIFATWGGGYLDGSSWKLSSGCVGKPVYDDKHGGTWSIDQSSGSVYKFHKESQGICGGWHGLLDELIKTVAEQGGTMEVVNDPNFEKTEFK